MSELVAERIRTNAERLKLHHLAEATEQLVERAQNQEMGYLEFLDVALEEEVGVREGRRFQNALKLSGLPHDGVWTSSTSRSSPSSRRAR